jgi:hypothetical protein
MTGRTAPQPPPPAAPPSPQELSRLERENAALTTQLQNQALRQAVAGGPGEDGARQPMGVVKNPDGRIVVTGRDGRQVIIDPKVVTDEDAVQHMVQTALEPPRVREPSRGPSNGDVAIVGIIFPCLVVIMLVVWRIVATSKRQGSGAAAAAVPAELAGRLARIEQAIEAVAIEVERISESERYSARLLTERLPEPAAANGQGAARPLSAPTLDATR